VGAIDTPIVNVPTDSDGRSDHTNAPLLDNWHPGWQQADCFGCHTDQSRIPDHSYPDTSLCYLCHGTNGLPGFGDNIAPLIKGIIAHPTLNTVMINWTTDEPCISRLILRTKEGDRLEFPVSTDYATSHKYTVSGLLSNTTYTYEIVATDKNRNVTSTSSCATLSFTTLVATTTTTTTGTTTGTTPQEFFSEITVSDVETYTAKFKWTTKSAAKCVLHIELLDLGTERVYNMGAAATSFDYQVVELYANQNYKAFVVALDGTNTEYTSKKVSFKTTAP
ncbi:MAG TPA: fibronectin type III domain-containing protein, partial [Candidatus Ozemobacteraceae bacterium]|nr:fibronectin type III domain-containing protein [Candidatus Ozemobacteraceae bacterium]